VKLAATATVTSSAFAVAHATALIEIITQPKSRRNSDGMGLGLTALFQRSATFKPTLDK
jgi:hypothetical protein